MYKEFVNTFPLKQLQINAIEVLINQKFIYILYIEARNQFCFLAEFSRLNF